MARIALALFVAIAVSGCFQDHYCPRDGCYSVSVVHGWAVARGDWNSTIAADALAKEGYEVMPNHLPPSGYRGGDFVSLHGPWVDAASTNITMRLSFGAATQNFKTLEEALAARSILEAEKFPAANATIILFAQELEWQIVDPFVWEREAVSVR